MTAAFARHLGVPVRFQSVRVDQSFTRSGALVLAAGHVNLALGRDVAALLGLSNTRTMRHWREQDPEMGERIARLPTEMLLGHVADVFDALVKVAKDPDPKCFQDRRLFLELTGNYRPSGNVNLSMTPISYIEAPDEDEDG
jgi:hypothetical protein